MRFSVVTADETETFYDGSAKILDSGVLVIWPDDEGEPKVSLSPSFWLQLKEPRAESDLSGV